MTPSPKSRGVAALLCALIGVFGIHRFYLGKVGTGLLWLFTGGLLGFGCFVDLVLILCGVAKDGDGRPLTNW